MEQSKILRDPNQLEKDIKMVMEIGERFEREAKNKLAEVLHARRMEKEQGTSSDKS